MIAADSAQRDTSISKRLLVFALCCGLALVFWVLSSPVQQLYWAASANFLEVKGALRNSGDFSGEHILAEGRPGGKHVIISAHHPPDRQHEAQEPASQADSSTLGSLLRQAQHGYNRLKLNKWADSPSPEKISDSQHAGAAGQSASPAADLEELMEQARQLGFDANLFTPEEAAAESDSSLTNKQQQQLAPQQQLGADMHSHAQHADEAPAKEPILRLPGINVNPVSPDILTAADAYPDAQKTQYAAEQWDSSSTDWSDPVISNLAINTSQAARSELESEHETPLQSDSAPSNVAAAMNLPAAPLLAPGNTSATNMAGQTPIPLPPKLASGNTTSSLSGASPQLPVETIAADASHGLAQHDAAAVAADSAMSASSATQQPKSSSDALVLPRPSSASQATQQEQQNATNKDSGASAQSEAEQEADSAAELSRDYASEEAVLKPAEPISAEIHREGEARKAVMPLLVQNQSVKASDYKLTRELVQSVAPEGLVMVTWANFHYLDFTMNWVQHVRAANISAHLVGAMDDDLLAALVARQVPCFAMQSGLSTEDFGWGSKQFHKMGREKIGLVLAFTSMGFDVLVSDVDTVWLRSPLAYMANYSEAAILISCDSLHATTEDGGLELYPEAGVANIGIMLFRASAKPFAEEWNKALLAKEDYWDQNAFNDLMIRGLKVIERPDRLFWGYDGKLLMGVLPVATFCSGHTFFVQGMAEVLGLQPYVVHATFQFSGTPGKRHRMREALLWDVDPEEYFRPPGGLLTFDLHLGNLVNQSSPYTLDSSGHLASSMKLDTTKQGHFKLVNAQIHQVRNAMAVASSLGRTLVMPQLWCGMDRWWAPHDGNIPGSSLVLPFPCPMDHIFDLEQMIKRHPEEALGPNVDWREHSLLSNSKFPAEDWRQAIQVHVCQGKEAECSNGNSPAAVSTGNQIALQQNLNDKQLQTALQAVAASPVLHFDDMQNAFGGHIDAVNASRFQHRTEVYTSLWCCVDAHPGHVWYDMWWDLIPHEDRHRHKVDKSWAPSTGP